ncbi:NAD(P)-binding protein [Tilletiopsis washingtonensis]|uniref:NAD(P)-binding protein n=1 Tax=Tilletiopsis washingtonensis TaxID=58919 RepID=A0A316YZV4_9BASI|nr:NAD(P)-binding protein [Tilletiopsis washingtonensis]PWN94779.1 NAD(P)-binding protein [Tilletiopsis washingtonensis]
MSVANLRFLITGGARGLGRGLTAWLVQRGHDAYILDADAGELKHTLGTHLPSLKPAAGSAKLGRFEGAECDISNAEQVGEAVRKAAQWHRGGLLDVLVNNAGRANPYWADGRTFEQIDVQEWRTYIDTNLSGAFYVSKAAVPFLKASARGEEEPRGAIVHTSSIRAKQSEPNQEGYASAKAGLLGMTHSMASSLADAQYRIRVNAVLPGWFPTDQESSAGGAWDDGLTKEDHEQHWAGRVGKMEDYAQAVFFMATNGFVTGQEIVVDGGMTRKMVYVE